MGTVMAAPAPVYAQPAAPVYTQPAAMTVTGVDMNRDGIPDALQQGAPLGISSYSAAPASIPSYVNPLVPPAAVHAGPGGVFTQPAASSMTVTGVDMNRDGVPDVLQTAQMGMSGYGAGYTTAPVGIPSYSNAPVGIPSYSNAAVSGGFTTAPSYGVHAQPAPQQFASAPVYASPTPARAPLYRCC